jgi:hypothetical protein
LREVLAIFLTLSSIDRAASAEKALSRRFVITSITFVITRHPSGQKPFKTRVIQSVALPANPHQTPKTIP